MDRFWDRFDQRSSTSCWNWTGTLNKAGYGVFHAEGKRVLAHRVAYELKHGPIAEGLVTDHLCGNRRCVNPSHLEAVSVRMNAIRAKGRLRLCSHRTHRDSPCDLCIKAYLQQHPTVPLSSYFSNKAWRLTNTAARNAQRRRNYGDKRSSGDSWTIREEEAVLAHAVTDRVLAEQLNRSVRAIQIKRCKLKVAAVRNKEMSA